ncbi:hypothetical protein QT970_31250, partial [Microcoleus sp. herbarium8]|uniref:hypothetical protein n=1 Tax=Microcoleus sp. herbarium8 TaxID=3055436 RepID=UPI002FD78C6F
SLKLGVLGQYYRTYARRAINPIFSLLVVDKPQIFSYKPGFFHKSYVILHYRLRAIFWGVWEDPP